MSTEAITIDQEFTETIHSFLDEADTVLVVNPAPEVFQIIIQTATQFDDDLPGFQVLATPDVLKTGAEDFILASQVADLIDRGTLELRTTTDIARNSLLVSDDEVITVVTLEDELTGLRSTDDDLVENVRSTFEDEWNDSETFTLRTPPLSRIQETLGEEFGDAIEGDFMMIVESAETIPEEGGDLDEVALALLVAANNEVLLYDISKWGEDIGLASKATFSRTKTQLEDRGLIETEESTNRCWSATASIALGIRRA